MVAWVLFSTERYKILCYEYTNGCKGVEATIKRPDCSVNKIYLARIDKETVNYFISLFNSPEYAFGKWQIAAEAMWDSIEGEDILC